MRSIEDIKKKFPTMTEGGAQWLVSCLDPFHDFQQTLAGYPDILSNRSVVQVHNQVISIVAPGAVNWDCIVAYTGTDSVIGGINYGVAGWENSVYNSATYTGQTFGSLTVLSDTAGVALTFDSATASRDSLGSHITNSGTFRVIGVAYEVHNTTAEIYKQGNVVIGCCDPNRNNDFVARFTDSAATNDDVYQLISTTGAIPISAGDLLAIPGSASWEAAKGCYVIPRLASSEIALERAQLTMTPVAINNSNGFIQIPSSFVGTAKFSGTSLGSFAPTISFFTGLSPETTLTVTYRTIVEYFPAVSSTLLASASPSPSLDTLALEAYAQISRVAPFAVPVSMNSAGDYFRMLLRAAKTVLPILGSVVPNPTFKLIAPIAGQLASSGLDLVEAIRSKRKKAGLNKQIKESQIKMKEKEKDGDKPQLIGRSQAGVRARLTKK